MREIINILILVPRKTARGGITNFYYTLESDLGENIYFFNRGSHKYPYHSNIFKEILRILTDYLKFIQFMISKKIKLVQTTTSFSNKAIIRDAFFLIIAKLLGKKTIVFYHGWDDAYAEWAIKSLLFRLSFFKTDASIVLSDYQRSKLIEWNYKGKIFKETTFVDEKLIESINAHFITKKFEKWGIEKKIKLLFLARLERTKGIFELINAFNVLNKENQLELIIAGDGMAEASVRERANELNLQNIKFTGFIEGDDKINVFKSADIYILPSYSEGMPITVLEAMAFGLPVLTTRVGGLVDFFRDGVNGFYINIMDAHSIIEMVNKLIGSKELMQSIALHNHQYAIENFLGSDAAKRNEHIFQEVLNA